jgi:Mrp family chromosome partitioning ATPase
VIARLSQRRREQGERLRAGIIDRMSEFASRATRTACRRAFSERDGRSGAMKVVAVYNLKGGVGKTTTAVNLSYCAATGGQRVLLWDLDPQAAATYAFRIRPRVEGFGKKSLASAKH